MTPASLRATNARVDLFDAIDPRLAPALHAQFERRRHERIDALPRGVRIVLAGHRAAGKSRLLPLVARRLGRAAVDLDQELERRAGRTLREWVTVDQPGFRAAERAAFAGLPHGIVVAVGGGFLSLHHDLLAQSVVVEVPITLPTYEERLSADPSRPRLRPELPLADELRTVFAEREALHRHARPMTFVEFALRLDRLRARRVATLPAAADPVAFAARARAAGADLLEVRDDAAPPVDGLAAAAGMLPLLVSHRGTGALPAALRAHATWIDEPIDAPAEARAAAAIVSLRSPAPLATVAALARWHDTKPGVFVVHEEPLGPGDPAAACERLLATQAALQARFSSELVTVLPVTPLHGASRGDIAALVATNALAFADNGDPLS
jgi:shikimate kinase